MQNICNKMGISRKTKKGTLKTSWGLCGPEIWKKKIASTTRNINSGLSDKKILNLIIYPDS